MTTAAQTRPRAAEDAPDEGEEQGLNDLMTDAEMPPLELLDADSDLSGFLSSGVSEELRRDAFRRVFSQPRFNLTDGLDDYAGDYRSYRPLGDLVTEGLRRHRERLERLASAARGVPVPADASADPVDCGEQVPDDEGTVT